MARFTLIHRKNAQPTHLDWRPEPVTEHVARWYAFTLGYGIVFGLSGFLMISGLLLHQRVGFIDGLLKTLTSPSVLLTDYFYVGGIGTTLFQAGIVLLLLAFMARKTQHPMNGLLFCALLTSCGFSFFGKNIINIWPVITGVWLYSKYTRDVFKNYVSIAIFGTCLGPIFSQIAFGYDYSLFLTVPIAISAGIVAGFALPALAANCLRFHYGFNLYNVGFTAGTIGAIFSSVMRSLGFDVTPVSLLSKTATGIGPILFAIFAIFVIIGAFKNKELFPGYRYLIGSSGRLYNDYIESIGFQTTVFNAGILGLMMLAVITALGGVMNGPVVGGIFTVAAFGALGKHPRNVAPVMIGVLLGGFLFGIEWSSTGLLVTLLFSTTLAPIAGHFGWFPGIIAGFFHLALVANLTFLHGGMNLYNNGFSGGIVAAFLAPIFATFAPGDDLRNH